MTFRLRHLLAALTLHGALFALLVGGVQCSHKPVRPPVIRAVLLDSSRQDKAEQKRQDEQRRKALERQKQLEQQKKLDEQKRLDAEALKKKKAEDALKKKQEDALKQKELADKKKAEEQLRKKREQEEQRDRQDQAKREVQEKARMEEELRQESTRRDVQRESDARAATEREKQLALWVDALVGDIEAHWNRPPGTADFSCLVRVQQLPDGTVTSAKTVSSCGSPQLDKSVLDAVYRASPLPRPADPSVFDRDLDITFQPS